MQRGVASSGQAPQQQQQQTSGSTSSPGYSRSRTGSYAATAAAERAGQGRGTAIGPAHSIAQAGEAQGGRQQEGQEEEGGCLQQPAWARGDEPFVCDHRDPCEQLLSVSSSHAAHQQHKQHQQQQPPQQQRQDYWQQSFPPAAAAAAAAEEQAPEPRSSYGLSATATAAAAPHYLGPPGCRSASKLSKSGGLATTVRHSRFFVFSCIQPAHYGTFLFEHFKRNQRFASSPTTISQSLIKTK